MAQQIYSPSSNPFANVDLNAIGSTYADQYTHNDTLLIKQAIHSIIYDIAPKQWMDLTILNQQAAIKVPSDEWKYDEMAYGRNPVVVDTAGALSVTYPSTQTVPTTDTSSCSINMIVVYPNDAKGTITDITPDTSIVVTPLNGGTLPAVIKDDTIALLSPIEADAASDIKTYFREDVTERVAYIQMLVMAMRFGKMELYKLTQSGWFDNYLTLNRKKFMNYFRTSLSNIYWNGTQGEAVLSDGTKAKTAGGVYPRMVAAGTATFSSTPSTIGAALEDAALSTEYGAYGDTRFLYCTPKLHRAISKYYKDELTRYTPDNMIANLMLDSINIGSSNIVIVPMARWNSTGSFSKAWQNRMLLIDQKAITPLYAIEEEYGSTLDRRNLGTRENFQDEWVSATFGVQFVNPLSCAIISHTP